MRQAASAVTAVMDGNSRGRSRGFHRMTSVQAEVTLSPMAAELVMQHCAMATGSPSASVPRLTGAMMKKGEEESRPEALNVAPSSPARGQGTLTPVAQQGRLPSLQRPSP